MSENCNIIAIFWIYGQFGAIRKSDSGHIIYKIVINSNLLSYKNTALILLLWVKVLFWPKNADFFNPPPLSPHYHHHLKTMMMITGQAIRPMT